MASSPAPTTAWMAEKMDSVPPQLTVSSPSGSTVRPPAAAILATMAARSAMLPSMGAYWLNPAATASATQFARFGSIG
jgi:hypothetical protein